MTKKLDENFGDWKIGDAVLVQDDGQSIRGVIESFQAKLGLIDVKIYEPGHRKHCLIRAYTLDKLSAREEQSDKKAKAETA